MKLTVLKIAGAVLAMSLVALEIAAQSGGGFPSSPNFNRVTIGHPGGLPANGSLGEACSGACDNNVEMAITAVDAFWVGTNNSGSTNAVGAPTGDEYMLTNQARSICIGNSSTCRETITTSGIQTLGNFGVGVSPSGINTINLPNTTNANNADVYLIGGSPYVISTKMQFNGAGAPTAVACNHCGTFSVTRNSIGNYTITHNAGMTNGSQAVCGRAGSASVGTAFTFVVFAEGTNSFQVLVFTAAAALTDPPNTEAINCIVNS